LAETPKGFQETNKTPWYDTKSQNGVLLKPIKTSRKLKTYLAELFCLWATFSSKASQRNRQCSFIIGIQPGEPDKWIQKNYYYNKKGGENNIRIYTTKHCLSKNKMLIRK
jgi:hypothetical protein